MRTGHRSSSTTWVRRVGAGGVVAALVVAAACGVDDGDTAPVASPPPGIDGVGQLPAALSGAERAEAELAPMPVETVEPIVRTVSFQPLGASAAGNRLIVIGDSLSASMARRYGNELCEALVPLGWWVEVNAEVSRFVDFGHRVLDRRLRPDAGADWDAAVVFLGTNYGGDAERFRVELEGIVDRLAPRPTILVTVTEFRPDRAQVNAVIRQLGLDRANVEVLEWAETSRADRSLLAADGVHMSGQGRLLFVSDLVALLGPSPDPDAAPGEGTGDDLDTEALEALEALDELDALELLDALAALEPRPEGECLPTSFTDDSAGRRPGAAPPPATLVEGGPPLPTAPASTTPQPSAPTNPPTNTTNPPATTAAPTTAAPTTAATTLPETTEPAGSTLPPPASSEPDTTTSAPPESSAPTTGPTTTAVTTTTAATTTTAPTTTASSTTTSSP